MAKSINKYYILIWFTLCSFTLNSNGILREDVIKYAKSFIGIQEETNRNDGFFIENVLLKPLKVPAGSAYCAAYVSFIYRDCNIKSPNSAWSPDWAKTKDAVYLKNKLGDISNAKKGDVVSFWRESKGRVGHVGIYERKLGNYIYTIEGNTSDMNDKGRDGIWGRVRHKSTIYTVTNYIDK